MDDAIERAYEIGEAAYALSQRGLFSAASWITELVSRPDPEAKIQIEAAVRNGRNNAQLHFDKSQNYAMGLNYFRMKEHLRAAERFALCSSIEATFMRFYSMYCFEVQKRRSDLLILLLWVNFLQCFATWIGRRGRWIEESSISDLPGCVGSPCEGSVHLFPLWNCHGWEESERAFVSFSVWVSLQLGCLDGQLLILLRTEQTRVM